MSSTPPHPQVPGDRGHSGELSLVAPPGPPALPAPLVAAPPVVPPPLVPPPLVPPPLASAPPGRADRLELLAFLGLLATTAVWGSTFFLIKDVVDRIPPMDMLAVRFALATVVLLVCSGRRLRLDATVLRRGAFLGALYGVAQMLQTVGLAHTAASVSGFVTGLYVVMTPLLAAAVLRTRIPPTTWVAVGLATVGLGVLSLRGFSVGYGELLTVMSAAIYAGHIIALGRLSDRRHAWTLAVVQTAVIAALCGAVAVLSGPDRWQIVLPASAADWWAVIYLGVLAGALTVLLQTWAQAHLDATRAAVVMAMEPVWAAGFAVGLGGESITVRMVVGGLAVLGAMYLVELAPRLRRRADRARRGPPDDPPSDSSESHPDAEANGTARR